MKRKTLNFIIDILLIALAISLADVIRLQVFHSENLWLELGIYVALYGVLFGSKQGIITLWNKRNKNIKEDAK